MRNRTIQITDVQDHGPDTWGRQMAKRAVGAWILWGGLACCLYVSPAARAQSRVTAHELEAMVTADHAAGRKDVDEVVKLATVAPSDRITDATLARLMALSPGPHTSNLLRLLAEASQFQAPPADEVPAIPAPSVAKQREILAHTVGYVKNAIPSLPDFLATRSTREFNDTAYALTPGNWPVKAGLHLVHNEAHQIGYRDGRDSDDPAVMLADADAKAKRKLAADDKSGSENTWDAFRRLQLKRKARQPSNGLNSWGEFGPILQTVLVDAALSNQIRWARWEPGANGQMAVFSYQTTEEKSHYPVNYCCVVSGDPSKGLIPFHRVVPYRGELTVDPATGAIWRVTLDAQTNAVDPVMRAAILVDYSPVKIEDATYICPTQSVALSLAQPDPVRSVTRPPRLSLNEVHFSNYHKFTATARLLTDEEASAEAGDVRGPDAKKESAQAAGAEMPETAATGAPKLAAKEATGAVDATTATAAAEPNPTAEPAAVMSAAPAAEPGTAVAPAILAEIRQSAAPAYPSFRLAEDPGTFQANSRLVDVGMAVYDKRGHAIRDIKPEEVQILDDGRPQKVAFFAVPEPVPVSAQATPEAGGHFSNRVEDGGRPAGAGGVSAEAATTVLLLDEENTAWADVSRSKGEILEFLKKLQAGERVALYTMDQFGFHVLTEVTADRAALVARLEKWAPNIQSVSHAEEAEARNRQQIDLVRTANDLNFVNGNNNDLPNDGIKGTYVTVTDPQLRDFGAEPGREALRVLIAVARHLAAVPGHKALVWVTSDNVLADWRDQEVGVEKKSVNLGTLVLMVSNMMNDAHVSVYPLDASQVEGGAIEASLEYRNVESNPTSAPPIGIAPRNMNPGRSTAQMHADLHAIQGTYRDLAQDTGGRAIRRGSDMVSNLESVFADGQATYQVSFIPDTAPDGRYHKISVEVPGRKGAVIHSRTGYMYSNEDSDARTHFEAAAWAPGDAQEIGLTADAGPSPADGGGVCRVRLKVRMRDLVLNPKDGRAQGKVDIYLLQRDEYNGQAHASGETLDLALRPETLAAMQKTGFGYERAFKLDARTGSVRVIVVDENSGKMASLTIPRDALQP